MYIKKCKYSGEIFSIYMGHIFGYVRFYIIYPFVLKWAHREDFIFLFGLACVGLKAINTMR